MKKKILKYSSKVVDSIQNIFLSKKNQKNKHIKFTVGKKIFTVFMVVLILMTSFGAYTLHGMRSINEKSADLEEIWLPSVSTLSEMRFLVEQAVAFQLFYANAERLGELDDFEQRLETIFTNLNELFIEYESVITTNEEQEEYGKFREEWESYLEVHEQVLTLSRASDKDEATKMIKTSRQQIEVVEDHLGKLVDMNLQGATVTSEEGYEIVTKSSVILTVFVIIVLFVSIVMGVVLSRNISRPLSAISSTIRKVSQGDLTTEPIVINNKDEIGELAHGFNYMTNNLKSLIYDVLNNSNSVASTSKKLSISAQDTMRASQQISNAIQEVSSGTEEQVSYTANANKFVSEMSIEMSRVAESINSVASLTLTTNEQAQSGQKIVSNTVAQMNEVQNKVLDSSETVNVLGEKSREIGRIVTLITDIASQTNLLALNAAIEAARAGEHGLGFAVVADEVRKLADQSVTAAEDITKIINEIQLGVESAGESMIAGTNSVEEGLKMMEKTDSFFQGISQRIDEIDSQSQEVLTIVEHVANNTGSMVEMIDSIAHISEIAAANSEEVTASTEEQHASIETISNSLGVLSKMAAELQDVVKTFKV